MCCPTEARLLCYFFTIVIMSSFSAKTYLFPSYGSISPRSVRVRSQWTRRINFAMLISNPTNRNGFGEHNSSLTILPFSTLTGWWTVLTRCVALWVYLYQTVDSLYGGGTILQKDCIVQ